LNAEGPGTRSELEDRFLSLIGELPQPRVNPLIEGIEVDFAYDDLVIEIDGPAHNRPRTHRQDRARDAVLTAAGYRVLRLTPGDLG
jgi:very-short-patch-repair endonuclease